MDDQTTQSASYKRDHRRGQTLAEFAITLPILLILIFGIIEFGRIFQAWVTIQNSARTAVRFASTGAILEGYDVDLLVPCDPGNVSADLRGEKHLYPVLQDGGIVYVEGYRQTAAAQQAGLPSEHLFATWYTGEDCEAGRDDHQQQRRDLVRLLSIYDEARRGAAGLALEAHQFERTPESVEEWLFEVWQRPLPRSDESRWFNVMICSSRANITLGARSPGNPAGTRFELALERAQSPWSPVCILEEEHPTRVGGSGNFMGDNGIQATYNVGVPWMDAGGPGDTVTVVVTFNHPLITPLGLATYIPIQSRRSAVNEAFRAANARSFARPGDTEGGIVFDTPTPTSTQTATSTATATSTGTSTPTITPTATDEPFTCDKLFVDNVTFFSNRFFIRFRNENPQNTMLTRSIVHWNRARMANDFPNVYLSAKALDTQVYWSGNDTDSPTDSLAEGTFYSDSYRVLPGGDMAFWEGVFINGPNLLATYMTPYDFAGTSFYFDHPDQPNDCAISLTLPPTPLPTDTPQFPMSPTPTFTPDCASSTVLVEFVRFETLGDVTLRVTNNRPVVSPLTDFFINWPARPGLGLVKVVAGGNNANDLPQFGGTGVVVWEGNPADMTAGTRGSNPADGVWITNYSFPPGITLLHLDFTGAGGGTLPGVFGISPSDFNGTWFDIGCGATGGGQGGGGGGQGGTIFLSEVPTPVPTNTPRPTNTPGPTLTPSRTPSPRPPTNTFTPRPPTNTFTPAPPTPTLTPTPFVLPTVPGSGGADG